MSVTENGLEYYRDYSYDPLWVHAELEWNGTPMWLSAKVYDEASEYGIDEGRVSKLTVTTVKDNWDPIHCPIDYDRGWDGYPEGKYEELMHWIVGELESIEPLYE